MSVERRGCAGGSSRSYDGDGAYTIGVRTDYTDASSGIATSTLTREQGTLNADACSAYGAPTTLVGTPAQSGLATGCYRYILTGTDNVGNTDTITTIVKVDTTAAGGPGPRALRLQRRRAYHRHHRLLPARRPGSFDVTASSTRRRSPESSTTASRRSPASPAPAPAPPAPTHWRRRPSRTAPSPSTARNPGTAQLHGHQLHAHLRLGRPDRRRADGQHRRRRGRRHTELRRRRHLHDRDPHRLQRRRDHPALRPPCSTREKGTLNADACSAYGPPPPRRHPAQSGLATGCYRYTLTGTDNVGNTTTVTTVGQGRHVRTRAPAPGARSTPAPTSTPPAPPLFYRPAGSGSFDVTATRPPTAQSGIPRLQLPGARRLHRLGRRARPAPTPWRRRPSRTAPSRHRPQQALLELDGDQLHAHSRLDGPTGGALTVNGTVATGGGSGSYDNDGNVTIGLRTDYNADGGSPASTPRPSPARTARSTRDVCSSLRRPHHARRHPRPERARDRLLPLTLTGTDNVGNTTRSPPSSRSTVTDPTAPSLSLADSSAAGAHTGTTAFYRPAG